MGKVSKDYHKIYYAERKKEYVQLLGGQCVRCGSIENITFDHIDPNSRKFFIAKILKRKKEFVLKELKKCQLLCDKCHRKKSLLEGSYRMKDCRKGSKSNLAVLNEEKVLDIRKLLKLNYKIREIAEKYSVSKGCIMAIKQKRSWMHIL